MNDIKLLLRSLQSQMTPTIAYSMIAIFALLSVALLRSVHSELVDARETRDALLSEYALRTSIRADETWDRRLAIAISARDSLVEQKWSGGTVGEVAATLDQKLQQVFQATSLSSQNALRIGVNPDPELGDNEGRRLVFEASGRADSSQLASFLIELGVSEPPIYVDVMRASFLQSGQVASISFSGHVELASSIVGPGA